MTKYILFQYSGSCVNPQRDTDSRTTQQTTQQPPRNKGRNIDILSNNMYFILCHMDNFGEGWNAYYSTASDVCYLL